LVGLAIGAVRPAVISARISLALSAFSLSAAFICPTVGRPAVLSASRMMAAFNASEDEKRIAEQLGGILDLRLDLDDAENKKAGVREHPNSSYIN
jgi:hypothetical protein